MSGIYSGQTLTPSEVVFLKADQFLAKAELPKQKLISFETKLYPLPEGNMGVAKQPLAELACMAAFLALEVAGDIRLEIRAGKSLLGLRSTPMLFANPGLQRSPWPEASLEETILQTIATQPAAGRNEVGDVIFRWIARDNFDPFGWVCDQVRNGLARRYLLTDKDYHLTQPATAAAEAQFAGTKDLLVACQHGHADIWDLLHTRVWQAVGRREAVTRPQ